MPSTKLKALTPPVSKPSQSAFRELIRALGLVERVMQPHFARFGISGAQWGVLRILHREEEKGLPALRLTDLSERLLIRPPSVTGVVDRLERSGLVVRDGSLTDSRAKQVVLTAKGRELVGRMAAVHEAQIDMVMGNLNPEEQSGLYQLLNKLGRHLETLAMHGSPEEMN